METLSLRITKHSENALTVAHYLKTHELVDWVSYIGLEDHESHQIAKKYLKRGYSGLVTFGVKGGFENAKKTVDSTKLFSLFLSSVWY